MNTKNLPMKFALVAVLISAALWGTFAKKPKLGRDLRGGHALIFEIRTNEVELRRLEQSRDSLRTLLAKTQDEPTRRDRESQLRVLETQLANLRTASGDPADLADRIIAHLKKRIDPTNAYDLKMVTMGKSRIEISMPMGDPASKEAARVYTEAMERLEKGNLHRGEISRVVDSRGEQRRAQIAALSGSDANRADLLSLYAEVMDEAARARAEIERLGAEMDRPPATTAATTAEARGRLKVLTEERDQALEALGAAEANAALFESRLLRANVGKGTLVNILNNYVPPRQLASAPSSKDKRLLQQRQELFETSLKSLRAEHPARQKDMDEVVAAYQRWAQARRHLDDPSDLIRLVRNAGVLEFRIVPETAAREGILPALTEEEAEQYKRILQDPTEGPDTLRRRNEKYLWFPVHTGEDVPEGGFVTADAHGRSWILLYNQPGWMMLQKRGTDGWSLTKASAGSDENLQPAVHFEFNENGARAFAAMTGTHVKKCMAILLDDEVYSAPVINQKISSRGQITGNFRQEDVAALARTLEAGSLPAKLNPEPVAQSTFGPSLGEQNLRDALRAGYWSALFVMGFMLVYYLFSGLVANVALMLNLLLVVGAMGTMDSVFTLAGIAGVVLVIGMGVDANVLICERLREEQAKGQSIRMALKNAYERAFSAIFDSNVTTLIVAAILGWVGTEEIKGFAITLGLGVAFNMFSAVYVTRWVFQFLLDRGWLKGSLRMMRLIGVPSIDWMGKRYYFWAASLALMVLGIGSLIWQGSGILGLEFSGGTKAVVTLKEDALIDGRLLPDDGLVRERFAAAAAGHERLYATASVEKIDTNRVSRFLEEHDTDKDGRVTLAEWTAQGWRADYFRQLVRRAGGGESLSRSDLERHLPARSYQISTTETDVNLFRNVASKAFGDAMAERQRIEFDLVMEPRHPILGVDLAGDGNGRTLITKELAGKADPRRRETLLDAEGGVLMVARLQTPAKEAEVVERITDMSLQPDVARLAGNRVTVMGLASADANQDPGKYVEFAVIVAPGDPAIAENPRAWAEFAQQEHKLLEEALHRREAMVAANVDASVAARSKQLAVVAMVLAWAAIIVYLWLRFGQARWGVAAVLCLVHDVSIAVGMVAVSGWLHATWIGQVLGIDSFKLDLTIVAALMTVIGYSVNDKIVVFDRIRENRGRLAVVTPQIINASINQTLSRTLLTSMAIVAVLIMYILGGQGIHAFAYTLFIGMVVGTYSSVAVAAPMLLGFREMVTQSAAASAAE